MKKIDYSLYCQDYNDIFQDIKIDFFNRGFAPISHIVHQDTEILLKYDASLYAYALDKIETKNLKILDIGCGRGGGANLYYKYFNFKEVHACDINKNSVDYGQKNNTDIFFSVQDLNYLNYQNKYFDIITLVDCFWDIRNINSFMQSVVNILSKDGKYISIVHLNNNEHIEYKKFLNNFFKNVKETNISDNIKNACKLKNKEIINLNLNDDIKMFLLEKNIQAYYEIQNKKSFKYVCEGAK